MVLPEASTVENNDPPHSGPYRVMVVDDSAVIRGLLSRWLQVDPGIKVEVTAGNGAIALRELKKHDIEVVILDIEMPVMDGMTALPQMLEQAPDLKIIMSSTLTMDGAGVTMRALEIGAADYVPKPTTSGALHSTDGYRMQLIEKVKALGRASRQRPDKGANKPAAATAAPSVFEGRKYSLRAWHAGFRPRAVAIASSTGGPQALLKVFGHLKNAVRVPIFITQHMPLKFTTILAEHLSRRSGAICNEAIDGEVVKPDRTYLAPGDFHMTIDREGIEKRIHLNQAPHVNFCRPAVDVMYRSLAESYGRDTLCVVMTGMGYDGLKGGEALVNAGSAQWTSS